MPSPLIFTSLFKIIIAYRDWTKHSVVELDCINVVIKDF